MNTSSSGNTAVNQMRGVEAWDSDGHHFDMTDGNLELDAAARAIKRGALFGIKADPGVPVRWVEVPEFSGSNRLRDLTRWLDEAWHDPDRYFTLWRETGGPRMLVIGTAVW